MQRGEIDGVTVLQQDLPGMLVASLTFGCGGRDEELDTVGLGHLVQHLVVWTEPYVAEKCTDMTSMAETSFIGAGSPEQIAEHFTAICSVISDPPLADLSEAVADADPGDRYLPDIDGGLLDPWGSLLARRFGPHGPGLARWPVVDYGLFTTDEIRRHVETFLTSGNAVLAVTTATPQAMRLRLPPGPRVTHATPPVRHQTGPIWYADEVRGAALALGVDPGVKAVLLLRVLMSRVGAALDRAGLAYHVFPVFLAVDSARHEFGLTITPKRGKKYKNSDAAVAAELLWAELQRLVHDGPDQADLDNETRDRDEIPPAALASRLESLAWLRSIGELEPATALELFGTADSYIPDSPTELRRLTPAAARDVMSSWLSSAMIVVPHGTKPDLPGTTEDPCPSTRFVPSGEVFRPGFLKRLGNKESLIIGADAISMLDGGGSVHMVPLSQALVVERDGSLWLAHTGHGCLTDISGFSHAVDKLRSVLPPRRFRRALS